MTHKCYSKFVMKLLNELIKLSSHFVKFELSGHFVKFEHSESDSEAEVKQSKNLFGRNSLTYRTPCHASHFVDFEQFNFAKLP